MSNSKNVFRLAVIMLVVALVFSVGVTFARYREEIFGDQAFRVRPLEQVSISSQQWQENEDGAYILTFSMEEDVPGCYVYLAISEGIVNPEEISVTLTMPIKNTAEDTEEGGETIPEETAEEGGETIPEETEGEDEETTPEETEGEDEETTPEETVVLNATYQPIEEASALYSLFGPGIVFRFNDLETGEQVSIALEKNTDYLLTVCGLSSAVQQTSLLRLFIEPFEL